MYVECMGQDMHTLLKLCLSRKFWQGVREARKDLTVRYILRMKKMKRVTLAGWNIYTL